MKLFKSFYPEEYRHSTYALDYDSYYEKGYRGILFDIDNTLVPHGAPATDEAKELFGKLRKIGFKTCLISNNKEPRVKPFAEAVGSPYICNAHKPSSGSYNKAFDVMNTDRQSTLFIGDQIFTDVYGANRVGMYTILVKPIHPKEEIQIVLKRYLERIVLYFYRKDRKMNKVKLHN